MLGLFCNAEDFFLMGFIRSQFLEDLIIKPWSVNLEKICLQRLSVESLFFKDFIGVIFQVFEILFGKNSTYQLFLCKGLLLIWFFKLKISSFCLLFYSDLFGFKSLSLGKLWMPSFFVLDFLSLFFLKLLLLI